MKTFATIALALLIGLAPRAASAQSCASFSLSGDQDFDFTAYSKHFTSNNAWDFGDDVLQPQQLDCKPTTQQTATFPKIASAGEQLLSALEEKFENGAWINQFYSETGYDAKERQTELASFIWAEDTQAWIESSLHLTKYNDNDQVIETTRAGWKDATFEFEHRATYTWDENGNQIMFVGAVWTGSEWVNLSRLIHTYENDLLTETLFQVSVKHNGEFDNIRKTSIQYDDAGRKIEETLEQWSSNADSWYLLSRILTVYGENGSTATHQHHDAGDWIDVHDVVTVINENGLVSEITRLSANGPISYENEGRNLYLYDDMLRITAIEYQDKDSTSNAYINRSANRVFYQANGNFDYDLEQTYDPITESWVDVTRTTYTYGAVATSVEGDLVDTGSSLTLYPSPARDRVNFDVMIETTSTLQIEVFDLLGRRVATIANTSATSGPLQFVWQPKDAPAGLYFVRFQFDETIETRSIVLMR